MKEQGLVSRTMRAVKSHDTGPEICFRNALWKKGIRYRLRNQKLPGKPDVVLSRHKIVVFVDGDFWHGRQWKTRGFLSIEKQFEKIHNRNYWIAKIKRNVSRDKIINQEYKKMGWRVVRFWESEIKKNVNRCVKKLCDKLMANEPL